jgi:hypothetical protein
MNKRKSKAKAAKPQKKARAAKPMTINDYMKLDRPLTVAEQRAILKMLAAQPPLNAVDFIMAQAQWSAILTECRRLRKQGKSGAKLDKWEADAKAALHVIETYKLARKTGAA